MAENRRLRSRGNTSVASLEEWVQDLKENGKMLVPGKWWKNVEKEDAEKMYECVITDVVFKSTRYEFEFIWVNDKDNTYIMLWTDVKRWMRVINPTVLN